jgi:cytochrome c-type biogenesis protein CcmF
MMKSNLSFELLSREIFLLSNNVILVVSAASIFLGTLFPMVYQALTDDLISIGPPYFNLIFAPLMVLLTIFVGIGPISRWKKTSLSFLVQQLAKVALASVVIGVILPTLVLLEFSLPATIAVALAAWIVLSMGKDIASKTANKPDLLSGLRSLTYSYWGMQLAHFGIAIMLIGIVLTSYFSEEKSVLLSAGQTADVGNYSFTLQGNDRVRGPNYVGDEVTMAVYKGGSPVSELMPQRRIYIATGTPSTEMAIDAGFLRDLFVTLGEQKESGAWSMTIYVKPFVRWIWLGALFMAFGGSLAAADKRYRLARQQKEEAAKVTGSEGLQTAS